MTTIEQLVADLREIPLQEDIIAAADLLESQAARIAELEAVIKSHGIPVKTYSGGAAHYVTGEDRIPYKATVVFDHGTEVIEGYISGGVKDLGDFRPLPYELRPVEK